MTERAQWAFDLLKEAVRDFYVRGDCQLFPDSGKGLEGLERSVAFRVGHYFAQKVENECAFSRFSVDMEYNRYGKESKRGISGLIRPDLQLHRRGSKSEDNILVCEFKVENASTSDDDEKLKHMTLQESRCLNGREPQEYNYEIGISLVMKEELAIFYIFEKGVKEEESVKIIAEDLPHV